MDLFFRIVCLPDRWPPSEFTICTLLTHDYRRYATYHLYRGSGDTRDCVSVVTVECLGCWHSNCKAISIIVTQVVIIDNGIKTRSENPVKTIDLKRIPSSFGRVTQMYYVETEPLNWDEKVRTWKLLKRRALEPNPSDWEGRLTKRSASHYAPRDIRCVHMGTTSGDVRC